MKRFLAIFGFMLSTLFSASLYADFDEGHEYRLLDQQPPVAKDAPVEVVEFFWYGCPHCYQFEPFIKNWVSSKPQEVEFVKIPATFNKPAKFHAYVFYALDLMGEADRLNDIIFEAMHKQGKKLADQEEMEAFLSGQNVDIETFRKAMKSFAVDNRVKRAESLFNKYELRGVPSIVVSGRYASANIRNYQQLVELIDFMIGQVRQEQKASE